MMNSKSEDKDTVGRFWLVGIRVDPNFPTPDFYTLLRADPEYWPIVYNGQIVLFRDIENAQDALDLYLRSQGLPTARAPLDPALTLDFAQALYLLTSQSSDDTACLLNLINTILDMLKAVSVNPPRTYRSYLSQIADHLTFNREFGSLLKTQNLERVKIIEAIQWALGAIVTKSGFFPKG
jgi:hypothetical protein